MLKNNSALATTEPHISILMLTHNAPVYTRLSVQSVVERTADVDFSLVVVDNASGPETVALLSELHDSAAIDHLILNDTNELFAKGNNIAASAAPERATHYLLLNSDIEVKDPGWLSHLMAIHKRGISTYGYVASTPRRVDGYCLLIDADVYNDFGGLDEEFEWWWSVTRLQAEVLKRGLSVQGYYTHDDKLLHYGGKSGDGYKKARGMDTSNTEALAWFSGHVPVCLDALPDWAEKQNKKRSTFQRLLHLWRGGSV
ncbi:MAG: glycosyltransferase [Pseudomonadota bacterium]